MCGFIVTNVPNVDLSQASRFQRRRGPDYTAVVEMGDVTLMHHLLNITGKFTPQPFIGNGIACVYNGEIYNSGDFGHYPSDGMCLLPAYEAIGPRFVRDLDGEFAIVILDQRAATLFLSADIFGTKPIHYSVAGSRFGVASYASALATIGFTSIDRVPPNQYLTIDLKSGEVITRSHVAEFSLRQYKTHFDDWTAAFAAAIRKRTQNCAERIFIGLSGGYDSGVIACELDRQAVEYKSYSIMGNERAEIIEERTRQRKRAMEFELISLSRDDILRAQHILDRVVEPVTCRIVGAQYSEEWRLHEDGASRGLAIICEKAKREGRRVYISGQGADEIFADYGMAGVPIYPHSNFGGYFPEDLRGTFPWPSVFGSTQAAYLSKEEYISGAFGIESRYPFLDRNVVQEFLSLAQSLKNVRYKSVLQNFLEQAGYPYAPDEKRGFVP